MTLTWELDLDRVKLDHHKDYPGQRSCSGHTDLHTQPTKLLYTATKWSIQIKRLNKIVSNLWRNDILNKQILWPKWKSKGVMDDENGQKTVRQVGNETSLRKNDWANGTTRLMKWNKWRKGDASRKQWHVTCNENDGGVELRYNNRWEANTVRRLWSNQTPNYTHADWRVVRTLHVDSCIRLVINLMPVSNVSNMSDIK